MGAWHKRLDCRGGGEAKQNGSLGPRSNSFISEMGRGSGRGGEKRELQAITNSANCPHYRSDGGHRVQRQNQRDGQKKWDTEKRNFKNTIPELRRTMKAVGAGEPSHGGYASIQHLHMEIPVAIHVSREM